MFSHLYYNLICEARKYIKKKKYRDGEIILRGVVREINEPSVWILLAVAAFYNGNLLDAEDAMRQAERLDERYRPLVQLKAYIFMKGAPSYDEALGYLVQLIKEYHDDSRLKRLRQDLSATRDFQTFQKKAPMARYVEIPPADRYLKRRVEQLELNSPPSVKHRELSPKPQKKKSSSLWQRILLLLLFIILITGGAASYFFRDRIVQALKQEKRESVVTSSHYHQIDMVGLSGNDYDLIRNVAPAGKYHRYYSVMALKYDYNQARLFIKKGEENKALIRLNRILLSNVSSIVTDKCHFLTGFIKKIEHRKFEKIPFSKIGKEPWLYSGTAVEMSGRVANLLPTGRGAGFSLMVNSTKPYVFDRLVDVFINSPVDKDTEGKTVVVKGILTYFMKEKKLYLEAREIILQ